jgi:putative zinc finger protein
MAISDHICQSESIAAYLDGQLEDSANTQFETHLAGCQSCRSELTAQRQFMCELDSALANAADLPMPKDFARLVSARAESDMRGVRHGGEQRRALVFCLALAATSFALLGVTAGETLLLNIRLLANKVVGVLGLLWTAVHDAVIGLTIISRVLSRVFFPESPVISLAALFVLLLAIASLSHLIIKYHRRSEISLYE